METTPKVSYRERPQYRIVGHYMEAVLNTLQNSYGLQPTAGAIYRKGQGEEPVGDYCLILGGVDDGYRALLSLSFNAPVLEAILDRGPAGQDCVRTFHTLLGENLSKAAPGLQGFRGTIPTLVEGERFLQRFLTRGFTAVVPITTECGPFTIQISLESGN